MTSEPGARSPGATGTDVDRQRFAGLRVDDFRRLAAEAGLSDNERSGFPDEIRRDATDAIFADISVKLPALGHPGSRVVDIGAGCSDLARRVSSHARAKSQALVLIDLPEVLERRRGEDHCRFVAGTFPLQASLRIDLEPADAVLAYSVVQYLEDASGVREFVREGASLLAPGGRMLIGDIPNNDMLSRFAATDDGRAYHQAIWGPDAPPFRPILDAVLTDRLLCAIIGDLRTAGFDAWLVPQATNLPMSTRREDLLVHRP